MYPACTLDKKAQVAPNSSGLPKRRLGFDVRRASHASSNVIPCDFSAPLTVVFVGNIFGVARLGTLAGSISMVHQIAGGLGAFAGAYIFDHRGSYDDAFRLMLVLSMAAAILTLLVRERPLVGAATPSPPG